MSIRSDAEKVARQLRRESRVASAEAVEAAAALLPEELLIGGCTARACPFEAVTEMDDGSGMGLLVCAIHERLAAYHPWHRTQFGLRVAMPDEVETPLTISAKFTPVAGDRPATRWR